MSTIKNAAKTAEQDFAGKIETAERHGKFFQSPDRGRFTFEGENENGHPVTYGPEDIRVDKIEPYDPDEPLLENTFEVTLASRWGDTAKFDLTADELGILF